MILQVQPINITAVVTAVVPTIISLGLTAWVYKVLNHIILDLKDQIKTLDKKVKELEDSENKWYRKYHGLKVIIATKRCKKVGCPVSDAVDELMSKTGEV